MRVLINATIMDNPIETLGYVLYSLRGIRENGVYEGLDYKSLKVLPSSGSFPGQVLNLLFEIEDVTNIDLFLAADDIKYSLIDTNLECNFK